MTLFEPVFSAIFSSKVRTDIYLPGATELGPFPSGGRVAAPKSNENPAVTLT